jgi:hypothetical protein
MRRKRFGRWVFLLLVALLAAPTTVHAQDGFAALESQPANPFIPWPIGRPHMEQGGFYVGGGFLYMRQNNPILSQSVAFRGFFDVDGSITGTQGFHGSGTEALNTNQLGGPGSFEAGVSAHLGWRFADGTALKFTWWHLGDTRLSATASLVPRNFAVGSDGADSFLFSPVFNFTPNYAGPPKDVNAGNDGATFGIWNAASLMTIDFVQRFDQFVLNAEIPIDEQEFYRFYGIMGGRAIIMWERFKWRTVDQSNLGEAGSVDQAYYTNIVSNRWYGVDLGCSGDWYWGSVGWLGAFACTATVEGGLGLDFVKERARYELGDFSTAASRSRKTYTFSPMLEGDFSLWWYPTEGVSVSLGWQALAVFNTVASRRPIDFDMSGLAPGYDRFIRVIHGIHVGVAIEF